MLTKTQKSRFIELDGIVKKSFAEAGAALEEIRDHKLYADKFFSFKEYCQHIGTTYLKGYKLIQAAKIAREVPQVQNVATAEAVARIPIPKRKEVVEQVLKENDGKLSAPAIQRAVNSIPKRKSPPERKPTILKEAKKDKRNIPIPSEVEALWDRRDEIQSLLSSLSRIRGILETAQEKDDLLFRMMDLQGCIAKLKIISDELKGAMPEYVCPKCNGVMPQNCDESFCKERGLISAFWFKLVPEEIRNLSNEN